MSSSSLLPATMVAILIMRLLLIHGSPVVDTSLVALNSSTEPQRKQRLVSCSGTNNTICNYGQCQNSVCQCDQGWITWQSEQACSYKQKTELEAFVISFFVGALGVDWFLLARGNAGYIVAGVFKLLTAGGVGIWWLVDWARILANAFPDGNGAPLEPW